MLVFSIKDMKLCFLNLNNPVYLAVGTFREGREMKRLVAY